MGVAAYLEATRLRPGIELAARLCTARLSVVARELWRHARRAEWLPSGGFPRIANGQSSWKREGLFFWRDGSDKSVAALPARVLVFGAVCVRPMLCRPSCTRIARSRRRVRGRSSTPAVLTVANIVGRRRTFVGNVLPAPVDAILEVSVFRAGVGRVGFTLRMIHSGGERHLSDCARRPEWLTLSAVSRNAEVGQIVKCEWLQSDGAGEP